jgi:serine/threonine-protein kinase
LGKYQIEQLLGEGGFGYVYRATDQRLRRAVAIKELKPEASQDKRALQRFLLEAQAAARLNHPNIVTIHDLEIQDGRYFIIMEFMAGGSLNSLLRQQPDHRLSPQRAVDIIAAICDGLAVVHDLDIVHRDIKPSNILFTADGRPKLTDFGIAHVPTGITGQVSLTTSWLPLGTVVYMAPEQARGERAVDGRADLYALGAVLYEAILGCRYLDFDPDNQLRNMQLIIHDSPIPPRSLDAAISRPLEQAILRALAKEPARRYQTAEEMGTALVGLPPRALTAGKSLITPSQPAPEVKPPTPKRPVTPPKPLPGVRQPTLLALAGAVGGVILLVALAWGAGLLGPKLTPSSSPSAVVTATKAPLPTVTWTSPPTVTRVPTVTLMPPAVTRAPTVTPVLPTSTPVPPTATRVLLPTSTPVPPTATRVLPTPAPRPGSYGTPLLVAPANGQEFSEANQAIELSWQAVGDLAADEFYDVYLTWRAGGKRMEKHWYRQETRSVVSREYFGLSDDGRYEWNVVVRRGQSPDAGPLSPISEQRFFLWQSRPAPPPTRTPKP